jgi:hypothetical protein
MSRAALTIIVVTPTRYGDRTTSEALAAASAAGQVKLIANRLPESDADREQIEDAIHERLNVAPSDVFTEGSEIRFDVSPLAMLDGDDSADERRRVLATAVAGSGRRIATGITASVRQLATVEHTIATLPASEATLGGIRIGTWEESRTELVRHALGMVDDVDRLIERSADNDVAPRIRRMLGPADAEPIVEDLEEWRSRMVATCIEAASLRFRKKSAAALVERHVWAIAVDPDVPTPARLGRIARRKLVTDIEAARTELLALLVGAAATRRAQWAELVDGAGAYRPGALLAAANAVGGEAAVDG